MTALVELAARRPAALLVPAVAVVAVLVALAVGAPDRLAVGSTRTGDELAGANDLEIVAHGPFPAASRVYRAAIETIVAGLRAEPAVAAARLGGSRGARTAIDVTLAPSDEAARERASERIANEIDPGPLRLSFGGEAFVLLDARHSLAGQLWRLELVALPVIVLIAVWILGPGAALAAGIAAVGAVAAALVGLRVAGAVAGASLLGIAPAAVIAAALAIEATALLRAIYPREAAGTPGAAALARWGRLVAAQALVAALVPVALVVTAFPAIGSIVLATAVGAVGAVVLSAVVGPPLLGLEARLLPPRRWRAPAGGEGARGARAALGRIGRSPIAVAVAPVAAIAATLVLAAPLEGLETRPLAAADLPAGSSSRAVAREVADLGGGTPPAVAPAAASGELAGDLWLAAALVAAGLGVALAALAQSPRALLAVPPALLPAAAALGAATFVLAEGHLANAFGLVGQGSLDTGATVCAVTALVAVGAGRSIRDCLAVREERRSRGAADEGIARAAATVVPASAAASLAVAAAGAVLAGADLYPAREFGLIVAAGLLIDLLLRPPLVAVLAR